MSLARVPGIKADKSDPWLFAKCPQVRREKGHYQHTTYKLMSTGVVPGDAIPSEGLVRGFPNSRWLCKASFFRGAEIITTAWPCSSFSEWTPERFHSLNGKLLSAFRELGCGLNTCPILAPLKMKPSFHQSQLFWARRVKWEESMQTSRRPERQPAVVINCPPRARPLCMYWSR